MIADYKTKQKSLEWEDLKWGKIGGTLSKGLFIKSDTLFLNILSQSIEDFEPGDDFTNDAMDRGNDLEDFAIEYVSKYTNIEFFKVGWLQSDKNKLLGISPDAINKDETICAEVKCFGRKKHTEILYSNEIPLENIHQCIHYFTVNDKLKSLYWCSFRPESVKSYIKELNLDSEVNIGTKSKPRMMTIEAARDYSLECAEELKTRIETEINKLNF